MTTLEADLNASRTLIELATRLGRTCLDEQTPLEKELETPEINNTVERIERLLTRTDPRAWQHAPRRGYASLLENTEAGRLLYGLKSFYPVGHLAVLRGLCHGALDLFFEDFRGRLELSDGVPFPYATRPIQPIFREETTPYQLTIGNRLLLKKTGFRLFDNVDRSITVTLDFSFRDQLDAIAWPSSWLPPPPGDELRPLNCLPRIGTIHTRLDKDRLDYKIDKGRVFWVRPKDCSLDETWERLEAVKQAQIAVLPELSLCSPDALQQKIEEDHKKYSPLIVAGSAHAIVQEGGKPTRVNECHVYIEGKLALRHRKIRPLDTRHIGNEPPPKDPIRENIDPQHQLTLLSGAKTRLAVVICSDLVDVGIPRLIEECGVNLLLVPSLTYRTGAFTGTTDKLATHCQGLSVVVNPILDKVESHARAPFTTIATVPRSSANRKSREYFLPRRKTNPYAVLDPNQPLVGALQWG